jgi:hypothetical protein
VPGSGITGVVMGPLANCNSRLSLPPDALSRGTFWNEAARVLAHSV